MRPVNVYETQWNAQKRHREQVVVGPGVFHLWGSEVVEFESGGVQGTVAIVEMPDGSVRTVLPHLIAFTDGGDKIDPL